MSSKSGNPAKIETAPHTEEQGSAQPARDLVGYDEYIEELTWNEFIERCKSHGTKLKNVSISFYPFEVSSEKNIGLPTIYIKLNSKGKATFEGDTYPAKEIIKKHGGKFHREVDIGRNIPAWEIENFDDPALIKELLKNGFRVKVSNLFLDKAVIL